MLTSLLLAATLWPSSVTQHCQPLEQTIIVGIAQSQSGQFLYCEQIEKPSEHALIVNYVYDGKTFAEKKINYSGNPATPLIHQKDFRSGEVRQAEINQQTIELHYQENSHKKSEQTLIPLTNVDVIDAGFDYFVRQHWNELQTGKVLPVNFASMPHLKVLPLRLSAQPLTKCEAKTEQDNKHFCFLVEIDNALLRLLLGNIKLTYDPQHRLTNFKGVVNIEDDKASTQIAKISYYYKTDYVEK